MADVPAPTRTATCEECGRPECEGTHMVRPQEPAVRLSSLAIKGSALAATLSGLSLALWLLHGLPLINPFLAAMVLVCSPFLYAMGRTIREDYRR